MGRNLANLYISESFQFITQISGSELQTGLGIPITSSLLITASRADNATSASYALNSTTASIANNAISASYALTASFAINSVPTNTGSLLTTASAVANVITFTKGNGTTFNVTVAQSGSVASASYANVAESASYALSASQAQNAVTASFALNVTPINTGSFATTGSNTFIGNETISGSLNVSGSVTGNVLGNNTDTYTSSAAVQQVVTLTQAEYNAIGSPNANTLYIISGSIPLDTNKFATTGSNTFVGNQVVTGSVTATLGFTGSLLGTASFATSASQAQNAVTASFALNVTPTNTGSLLVTASISNATTTFTKGDGSTFSITTNNVVNANSASVATSASYALNATSASYSNTATSSSFATNATSAATASFLPSTTNLNVTSISASNAVFQSASIGFLQTITGSVVNIGDAFVVLNTSNATRYAGIKVEDSGSAVPQNYTASLQYDSQTNDWFYEYSGSDPTNFGISMFGPEYNTIGSPTYLTNNRIPKGNGGHHLNDSNISDNGSTVSISTPLVVTGSINATSVTSSLLGTASYSNATLSSSYSATATSSSYAINATSASYALNATSASFAPTNTTGSFTGSFDGTFTGNLTGTSSYASNSLSASYAVSASQAQNAVSSSYALTASFASNAVAAFPYTGSATITGSLALTGSYKNVPIALTASQGTASVSGYTGSIFTADFSRSNQFTINLNTSSLSILQATNITPGQTVDIIVIQSSSVVDPISSNLQLDTNFKTNPTSRYLASVTTGSYDLLRVNAFDSSNLLTTYVKNFTSSAILPVSPVYVGGYNLLWDFATGESYPGSGSTVTDLSGFGNNGTVSGATYTGSNGGVFTFDGSNDFISAVQATSLSPSGSVTFGGWMKSGTGDKWLYDRNGSSFDSGYGLFINAGGAIVPHLFIGGSLRTFSTANTSATSNQWVHIMCTWDGTTAKVYFQSVLDANTSTYTGAMGTGSSTTYMGISIDGASQPFNGSIGEWVVYSEVALTSTQVANIYNGTKARYGY
jgi:hypothetical protein